MNVLVDTSIWSLALRRDEKQLNKIESAHLTELKELINEVRVKIIGPIRQEILSGISDNKLFSLLKEKFSYFEDTSVNTGDYELAAELYNLCRKKGIQGSHIDYLICSVAIHNGYSIYTLDNDFLRYNKYCNFKLHQVR